ncbi:MAG: hypothetical protein A3H98_07655 [Bacteroidetes bacterium RIFCSPLOWO2_02_FULL_36_8]|nr:MAG: hypothetical protein A3H98_07655 [Bacteroidetes bacterium RIFCSPLOWO2_02_FULL_36_8]OFY71981.1 MAG: hypothetical protein A3G23_00100 [Bacteroidetes bacterium RIFCSPLOWO2_12_FULL_37_12]
MSQNFSNIPELQNDEEYYVIRKGSRNRSTSSKGSIKRLKKILHFSLLISFGIIFLIFLLVILNNMGEKYKKGKKIKKAELTQLVTWDLYRRV